MSTDQSYAVFGGSRSTTADETNRLDAVIRSIVNQMATMTLVTVKAVSGQLVDIKPLVSQIDGAGNKVDHGIIHNVPVFRLQSGSSAIIIDPQVGDIGLAIFAHNDISSAKRKKGPSLPGSRRKFDWADAIYLGGVLNAEPDQFIRIAGDGIFLSSPMVQTSANLVAGNGATGSFSTPTGQTVTVVGGVITSIA